MSGLVSAALLRLGYTPLPDVDRDYDQLVDDVLLVGPWPERRWRLVITEAAAAQQISEHVRDCGVVVVTAPPDRAARYELLQSSNIVLVTEPKDESLANEAAACGALVVGIGEPYGAPSVRSVHLDAVDLEAVARAIVGISAKRYWPAAEAARRRVMSSSTALFMAIERDGDDAAWQDLSDHFNRVKAADDDYMWGRERDWIYILLRSLAVDGAVVEVGVGDGGTFSILTAFGGGRPAFGFDDFSYQGEAQQRAFTETMQPFAGWSLISGSSHSAMPPDRIAFLHVDGDHSYEGCLDDLERFATKVVPGGVLAVDDYMTKIDQPNVVRATDEFMTKHRELWSTIGCGPKIAFWRRLPDPIIVIETPPAPELVPVPSPEPEPTAEKTEEEVQGE